MPECRGLAGLAVIATNSWSSRLASSTPRSDACESKIACVDLASVSNGGLDTRYGRTSPWTIGHGVIPRTWCGRRLGYPRSVH